MEELIKIPIGEKIITLKGIDWDTDIDVDDITKIHYENLYGEIVTVSALLNRVGLMRADCEHDYEAYKLDCKTFEAQKRSTFIKKELSVGGKKPGEGVLDSMVDQDPEVIAKRKQLVIRKRNLDYVESLYWAVSSKDKKLSVLMKQVTPEEFATGIIEGTVNTFYINKFEPKLTK